jgi:hypothetical protein
LEKIMDVSLIVVVFKAIIIFFDFFVVREVEKGEILSFSYIEANDVIFRTTAMRRADLQRHSMF